MMDRAIYLFFHRLDYFGVILLSLGSITAIDSTTGPRTSRVGIKFFKLHLKGSKILYFGYSIDLEYTLSVTSIYIFIYSDLKYCILFRRTILVNVVDPNSCCKFFIWKCLYLELSTGPHFYFKYWDILVIMKLCKTNMNKIIRHKFIKYTPFFS